MRTDLNVWLDENETIAQYVSFEFQNRSVDGTGWIQGNLYMPPIEVIASDVMVGIMIMQTVILLMILYYTWRKH